MLSSNHELIRNVQCNIFHTVKVKNPIISVHSKAQETAPCSSLEPHGGLRELNLNILHDRTWAFITKGIG